ncbi:MAG: oxygen-independent coproporphyrinogen III oxidase [Salibacteraceae bacterium]|nr:oxygen-independent coproporphyrinogen III oxidase [Salibacteraceae bacterium]MDP4688053.1 oxygen-independent coproporphyrinogen III oxidase [Salibacteraceae bacterium]
MELIDKYNVPGPRYTSYPTVPFWETSPTEDQWKQLVKESFTAYNQKEGISVYIHLPYCESLCTFCGCTTRITVNHGVEEPYITGVLNEWSLYLDLFDEKPIIKEIHLGGGTPTFFSPENLSRLINGIKEKAVFADNIDLGFEANPRTTSLEHLETMHRLGFKRLSLGIQDFDPLVQKTINRVQSFSLVKQVTDWARKIGYNSINFDLVYGLPHQSPSSIENTIDLVNLIRPDRIAYFSYAHVPWVKPGQRSFTEHDLPTGVLKQKMYALGKQMLTDAGYVEIGMDHFALPQEELTIAYQSGKMHRNFMGYTTQPSKLMIGLGVSAISDTWSGFGQNIKVVESYLEKVNSGQFPIMRGHILSEEDLLIRKLILDLMCQFKTDIPLSPYLDQEEIYASLEEMKKDFLVDLKGNTLRVTNAGKPYVRNICMAFDQRLKRKQTDTHIFSMTI